MCLYVYNYLLCFFLHFCFTIDKSCNFFHQTIEMFCFTLMCKTLAKSKKRKKKLLWFLVISVLICIFFSQNQTTKKSLTDKRKKKCQNFRLQLTNFALAFRSLFFSPLFFGITVSMESNDLMIFLCFFFSIRTYFIGCNWIDVNFIWFDLLLF